MRLWLPLAWLLLFPAAQSKLKPNDSLEYLIPPACVQKVRCWDDWRVVNGHGTCAKLTIQFSCYRVRKLAEK